MSGANVSGFIAGLKLINELQNSIQRSQERLTGLMPEEDRVVFVKLLAPLVDAHEKSIET